MHAWSHHPGGTTYVAAERGLFTVSVHGTDGAPVSDLDPLELYGAPVDPGAAVGVVCDVGRSLAGLIHGTEQDRERFLATLAVKTRLGSS